MKKLISSVIVASLISTSVFAQQTSTGISSIVADYQEAVFVNNGNEKEALNKMVQSLKSQDIQVADLMDYVKNNATAQEYASFEEAILLGSEEISASGKVDSAELQAITTDALQLVGATGSSYRSCTGEAFFGTIAFITGAVFAFKAIETYAEYQNSDGVFSGRDERLRDEATEYIIISALATATGAAITSVCE